MFKCEDCGQMYNAPKDQKYCAFCYSKHKNN